MPTCTVWVAAPDPGRDPGSLNGRERERLRSPADRDRSGTAALLLRSAVGDALGVDPAEVRVVRVCAGCGGPHGRPRLPGTGLAVSVSRSGERVLVAVTDGARVGVDVEQRHPVDDGLARELLGPGERAADGTELLRTWTRREAVVKATGEGLTVPLGEVVLGPPDQAPRLASYRGGLLAAQLVDLDVGAAYVACVAVLTATAVELDVRAGGPLLARHRTHPGAAYGPVVGCDPDATSR